jgi:hypothetical protein
MWNRNFTGIIVVVGILLFDLVIYKNQNRNCSKTITLCYLPEDAWSSMDSTGGNNHDSYSPVIFKFNYYEK